MSVEKLTLETPFPENDADPEKDEDGIEKERPEHDGKINEPYDPELIRIRPTHIVVDQVITRLKFSEIDLAPDFQRHAGIWTRTNKSRLIESLLLRIPIPAFYVAADESELWSVVDGIQRMSTIDDYVNDRFKLPAFNISISLKACVFVNYRAPCNVGSVKPNWSSTLLSRVHRRMSRLTSSGESTHWDRRCPPKKFVMRCILIQYARY